jgi:hypothetical protein
MRRHIARRLLVFALSVAVAAGFVARSVYGLDLGHKVAAAAAMGADMPMPGKCDGCPGGEKGMAPSCTAFCASMAVVSSMPVADDAADVATMTFPSSRSAAGRAIPPDPHPPRSASLS